MKLQAGMRVAALLAGSSWMSSVTYAGAVHPSSPPGMHDATPLVAGSPRSLR
jgi:hypothetical protein